VKYIDEFTSLSQACLTFMPNINFVVQIKFILFYYKAEPFQVNTDNLNKLSCWLLVSYLFLENTNISVII